MRVVHQGRSLAWGRPDDWWSFVAWMRGREPIEIMPWIKATYRGDWLKLFAPHTDPGYFGPPTAGLPPVRSYAFACEDWRVRTDYSAWGNVWPLRLMTSSTAGRVKMWRKRARNGELPPIVLLHVSLIEGYVLIDGHDRLQAALLEGVRPTFLVNAHTRQPQVMPHYVRHLEQSLAKADVTKLSQQTIDRFNDALITAHGGGRPSFITRFRPMSLTQWRDEVIAQGKGEDVGELIYATRSL